MWNYIYILILGIGAGLILLLLKKSNNESKGKKYIKWLEIIGIFILCATLVLIVKYSEKSSTDKIRYNTVEDMIRDCMPNDTIDSIIYYEKYAIIFLNDRDLEARKWFTTYKDSNGWKAIKGYSDRNMRLISNFNSADILFIEVDSETGLDFVIYDPYNKNLDEVCSKITDTNESKFEKIRLPSGYDFCYTFTDVDKTNYEIIVEGVRLKIGDINFIGGGAYYNK